MTYKILYNDSKDTGESRKKLFLVSFFFRKNYMRKGDDGIMDQKTFTYEARDRVLVIHLPKELDHHNCKNLKYETDLLLAACS